MGLVGAKTQREEYAANYTSLVSYLWSEVLSSALP